MAKLHFPPFSTLPSTPSHIHMLDNPYDPSRYPHSYYSWSFHHRETQHFPNLLTKRFHKYPNALKNGTGSPGISQEDDCHKLVHSPEHEGGELSSSAMAIAMSIQRVSACPVKFVQRVEKVGRGVFSCPSAEFRSLCNEQLSLCANIIRKDTILSLYIRPAGSYVTDQLELRQAAIYPGQELAEQDDILVLVGTFGTQASLRSAEAAFAERQVEDIPEHNVLVVPMIKDLFLVGLLVAEHASIDPGSIWSPGKEVEQSSSALGMKREKIEPFQQDKQMTLPSSFTTEQKAQAIKIARTLAVAYVMDQRALLLQQTSWQKGVRMSNLMEQIHGPLSNIRTLSKMLIPHLKRSEIPHDLLENILVQGEHMKGLLQELQDTFYYTKANLIHFREEDLNRIERVRSNPFSRLGRAFSDYDDHAKSTAFSLGSKIREDLEFPMPPLALAALQQSNIRPCNVSKLLSELVNAGDALAHSQQQTLQLIESTPLLQAAIEETALRQALSNLLDSALLRVPGGGWVKVEATEAPGGGVLVVIDDNGPDMSLMTQTHSLAPFGSELSLEARAQDNIAWNFVAGITIAREILEHYGSVLRMLSPYLPNALLGAGGTHIEVWLPAIPVEGAK